MRKIVAGLFISLDGVVENPQDWHFPYFNDEMGVAVSATLGAADTVLLGRKTYDSFAGAWPEREAAGDVQRQGLRGGDQEGDGLVAVDGHRPADDRVGERAANEDVNIPQPVAEDGNGDGERYEAGDQGRGKLTDEGIERARLSKRWENDLQQTGSNIDSEHPTYAENNPFGLLALERGGNMAIAIDLSRKIRHAV